LDTVFTSFTTFMLTPEMTLGHLGVMEEQIAEMSFNATNKADAVKVFPHT